MSAPDAAVTGLCFRCGGPVASDQVTCPYCGMPVILPPPPALAAHPGPAPIMTAGPTLTAGPPARRRLGRRQVAALALVVLLLVGAGAAAVTVRLVRPDPAATVRDYFSALAAGHAAQALRYVSAAGQFTSGRYPMLSDAGLTETSARPSAVHVGAAAAIKGVPAGVEAASVKVSFRTGGGPVQETLVVLRTDGDYRIQSPFVQVVVANAAGRKVTVNGIALGDQQLNTLAFPGAYHAVAAANQLLGGGQATATLRPGPTVPLATIDLGAPALAPGALDEIRRQVRTAIDACAATGQPLPPGCPFGLNIPGTPTAVHWSVTAYPTVDAQVTQSLFGVVVAVGGPGGKVHWDVSYTGFAGDQRHESGDSDFTVNGSATQTATGIQVSLAG